MTQTTLLIAALIVAVVIAIALYWKSKTIKFIVVALSVLLANAIYFSLDGVKGWPAEEPKEVNGILASVVIVNPSGEDKGGIYISLFPKMPKKWYDYVYPREAPKTYYIEYSNDRAAKFESAKKAVEEGKEVRINGIPPKEGKAKGSHTEEANDNIAGLIQNLVNRILAKEKDTYEPNVPDVEILAPSIPIEKGSNQ